MRVRIDYHGMLPYFDCAACMETYPDSVDTRISCSKGHKFCVPCAHDYIKFCIKEYATGKIPIKCQMCKEEYNECDLYYHFREHVDTKKFEKRTKDAAFHIYFEDFFPDTQLSEKYLKASLDAGLINISSKNVPVECKKCLRTSKSKSCVPYFELFQPNFQSDVRKFYKDILIRDEVYLMRNYGKEGCDFFPYIKKRNFKTTKRYEKLLKEFKEIESPEKLDGKYDSVPYSIREAYKRSDLGLYMHCKRKEMGKKCGGHTCLRCLKEVTARELMDHDCEAESKDDGKMFRKIAEVLDSASFQTCPKCKTRGVKDLACTHITCNKCKAKWCYLCRKLKSDFKGNSFSTHNQWKTSKGQLKKGNFCPMYLRHLYGGSALNALTLFHLHKRMLAIDQFQKSLTPSELSDFKKTVKKHFRSLFNKRDLMKLLKVLSKKFPKDFKGFENQK
mmetsp:Transcript_15578/g.23509  ORF Transcript_15578/g.23509 Transcript_15578/m.23509 type:complete len:446 (+) Transcript_15578:1-1338(+)